MTPLAVVPDISAIIITRNEEANVDRAVHSVLDSLNRAREAGYIRTYEALLVDSASSDRTVEVASRHPIGIVRLDRHWPLSPSAGRVTGARLTSGRLLLFVDGDYFLNSSWLPTALGLVQLPGVAGVSGVHFEEATGTTVLARRWASAHAMKSNGATDIESIPIGLIRRDAYEAVGGFHPYLRGGEDRDFGMRLRKGGWQLLETAEPMGIHRHAQAGRQTNYFDYYRSVAIWSIGDGQACRARWKDIEIRRRLLHRYANSRFLVNDLQFLSVVGLILLNFLALFADGVSIGLAAVADASMLAYVEAWRRSKRWDWREALFESQGTIYGPFRQVGFLAGFLRKTPHPSTYPRNAEIVKPLHQFGI